MGLLGARVDRAGPAAFVSGGSGRFDRATCAADGGALRGCNGGGGLALPVCGLATFLADCGRVVRCRRLAAAAVGGGSDGPSDGVASMTGLLALVNRDFIRSIRGQLRFWV